MNSYQIKVITVNDGLLKYEVKANFVAVKEGAYKFYITKSEDHELIASYPINCTIIEKIQKIQE